MSANRNYKTWQDLRVWLVGASSGIGYALAEALLESGAWVTISARNIASIKLDHSRLNFLPLDVTDREGVNRGYKTLIAQGKNFDLVVYLAAVYEPMEAAVMDMHSVRKHIEVNLIGAYHVLETVQKDLMKNRGGLALVASVAGYRGLPRSLAYSPSKAALISLAEVLHLECTPQGMSVYLINPGFVQTRLTDKNTFSMPAIISPAEAAREIMAGLAKGRFEIHFPRRFTRLMRFFRLLPYWLYFPLVRRITGG